MAEKSHKYQNFKYTNYFGNEDQFIEETGNPVLIRKEDMGVCWICLKNGIYYLNYNVDDLEVLNRFIDYDLSNVDQAHGVLLELKFNGLSSMQKPDNLVASLTKKGFIKQSHHIAYVKTYFKNDGNNGLVIRLNQSNITHLCALLPKIPVGRLSLTNDLINSYIKNEDYLLLGYYKNGMLYGYIILHSGGNLEHIGFIRDVYVDADLDDSDRQQIGSALFNSALNAFADNGFDKAVIWNDINDRDTCKLLEKYGFSSFDNEIIVYTRYSQPNL